MPETKIKADNLKMYFKGARGSVKAVDDISFDISAGETLGLVGESGSGKSTVARLIIRLLDSIGGSIFFEGNDITSLEGPALKEMRKNIQIVFQDPYTSLNPMMSIGQIIREPLRIHGIGSPSEREAEAIRLLELVGLNGSYLSVYPHEISGGQQQRVGIARALALKPSFLACDEPVSALDVSIQAQILNLLLEIQSELGLTMLFIAHNLAVVKVMTSRVAVMYLGKLVEIGSTKQIFNSAQHPYTNALLSAIPKIKKHSEERIMLKGEIPSPINPPSGCRFRTRCPEATDECSGEEPELKEIEPGHVVACIKRA